MGEAARAQGRNDVWFGPRWSEETLVVYRDSGWKDHTSAVITRELANGRHIAKGALTWVPPLSTHWRRRRALTGGTDSPRYCYSVWLRHLVTLQSYGFQIKGARVGELGPGDTIGTGLAALLSGADHYIGLDVLPLSAKIDLEPIFDELVQLYSEKEPIPDNSEFPRIRPQLESYEFPIM